MNINIFFEELLHLVKGRWPHHWRRRSVYFSKTLFSGVLLVFFLLPYNTSAQCAMCRAVLESEENTVIAEGVNNGIVYLMAIPYILLAVLFYFVYKKMTS